MVTIIGTVGLKSAEINVSLEYGKFLVLWIQMGPHYRIELEHLLAAIEKEKMVAK
jgi:hypothetical protein